MSKSIRTSEELLTSILRRIRLLERRLSRRAGSSAPVGTTVAYLGTVAPSGWAIADGGEYLRTSPLFALIGTTYGDGNGTTTANLPDLRKRVPVGFDATDPDFDEVGMTGGEKEHTLSEAELAAHGHRPPNSNGYFIVLNTDGNSRRLNPAATSGSADAGGSWWARLAENSSGGNASYSTANAGGGEPHNNMPPFVVMNYIVKL